MISHTMTLSVVSLARFDDIAKLLPYCDEAKFFDNDNGFVLVAEYRNGELLPVGDKRPAWLLELINAIK